MLFKLILLLTTIPLVELYFLIQLTQWTSLGTTLLIIITTGIIGGILARMEGLRVLENIKNEVEAGRSPGDTLIEGAVILVAGALLLTPGLLTDLTGFLALIPFTRRKLIALGKKHVKKMVARNQIEMHKKMGFGPIRDEPPDGAPPLEDEENT